MKLDKKNSESGRLKMDEGATKSSAAALDVDAIADEDELESSGQPAAFASATAPPVAAPAQDADSFLEHAKDVAGDALENTKKAADQAMDNAKMKMKSQIASEKDRAADVLSGVTNALHQTGQELRENGQSGFGNAAEAVADQVDRAAGFLKRNDVDAIAKKTSDFARSQPVLFVGGAVLLGVALARFLKSSAKDQTFATATNKPKAAPRTDWTTPDSHIPAQVYGNADPSRHLDQISDDAIPSKRPLTAHDYVPGFPPQSTGSSSAGSEPINADA